MLPLRDINPVRTTPFVNYLLILANVAAFEQKYPAVAKTVGEALKPPTRTNELWTPEKQAQQQQSPTAVQTPELNIIAPNSVPA